MPVPSPRNSIRIARGNYADLLANANAFGEGEIIYAVDEDRFYASASGTLAPVGSGVLSAASIDALGDVDTTTATPAVGQVLKWDGTNWTPADDANTDAVTSVAGKTGDVTLVKTDITDFSDSDYATAAQGLTADSATQPLDNVSTLTNDAGYITLGEVPGDLVTSVQGRTGDVVVTKTDLNIENVDNTSDADKPVSTAQQAVFDVKADLVGGLIPTSQIPAIAITEFLGSVGSESAMLTLVGQPGDWCLRTDKAVGYVITGPDPSLIANWEAFTVPGSAVTSINSQIGDVVLGSADVGAATAAQGALADTAVQPGDNISTLTNDAGYITATGAYWDRSGTTLTPANAGDVTSFSAGTAALPGLTPVGDPNTGIYSPGADQVAISTNGTGRLFIASDGSVGLNKSNPGKTLDVVGQFRVRGGDTNAYSLIEYGASATATNNWHVGSEGDGTFRFYNGTLGAGSERLRITSDGDILVADGNRMEIDEIRARDGDGLKLFDDAGAGIFVQDGGKVGIGTSSPSALLHVSSTGSVESLLSGGGTSGNTVLHLKGNGNAYKFIVGNSAAQYGMGLYDVGNAAYRLYVNSAGNVGIGTTSPGDKLDVLGIVRATNTTDSNFYSTFSNPDGLTRIRAYGGGSSICFDLGTSEKARIDSSGRLLVGATIDSGGALLQVNGDRIRVATAKTPASATATGTAGEICWDASYIYVCTATNTWKRTAISTW